MTRQSAFTSPLWLALRWFGRGLCLIFALLLLCLALVLVVLNTRWGREQAARQVNLALSHAFQGELEIREIGALGLGGVRNVDGVVKDQARRTVLAVENLDVNIDVLGTLWELLAGESPVTSINVESARVDHARVALLDAENGVPSLARAFEARQPSPPSPSSTELFIQKIELEHVWMHGRLAGTPIDAEVSKLLGRLRVASSLSLAVDEAQLEVRALPVDLDPRGRLELRLQLPLDDSGRDKTRQLSARFQGSVWSSKLSARVNLEGDSISATLLAPAIERERLARLWPEGQFGHPVSLRARIFGTLAEPHANLRLHTASGSVTVDAQANLQRRTAELRASVDELEVSAIHAALPRGTLSLNANVALDYPEPGGLNARYRVSMPDQAFGDVPLPATSVNGHFDLAPGGAWAARGGAHIEEPGAATTLDYRVETSDGRPVIQLNALTELNSPTRLVQWVPGLELSGKLRSWARFDGDSQHITANVAGRLHRVAGSDWLLEALDLDASARGSLTNPKFELGARFAGARVQGSKLRTGELHAEGTRARLKVRATSGEPQRLNLRADVVLHPDVRVIDPEISVHGAGTARVRISGAGLDLSDDSIVVRDMTIEGPDGGTLRVSLEYGESLRELELEADDFDFEQALGLLGLDIELPSGALSARASFHDQLGKPTGFLQATLQNLGYGPVEGGLATARAELVSGELDAEIDAVWRDSRVEFRLNDVEMTELSARNWQQSNGSLSARAHLELERLGPLLRLAALPFTSAAGAVEWELYASRPTSAPARISTRLTARGLSLAGKSDTTAAAGERDVAAQTARTAGVWSISGLDLDLSASEADGQLSLDAAIADEEGRLVQAHVDASLPGPIAPSHFVEWPAAWRQARLHALVWVLPRRLSAWPPLLRLPLLDGVASATLEITGSRDSMQARLMGQIEDFGAPEPGGPPLDVAFSGHYTPQGGELRLGATSKERRVAKVESLWRGDALAPLLSAASGPVPDVSLRARFDRLPTAALPVLATKHVQGHLSGNLDVGRLSEPMRAELHLSSRDLSVESMDFEKAHLSASIEGRRIRSLLELSGRKLGRLEASVAGQARLAGGELAGLEAELRARSFELGTLRPLVSSYVSSLSGKLDARLAGRLSRDAPNLRGTLRVRDGAAQLPSLGQTFHDIDARVQVEPDRVRLSSLKAKGLTGELTATGSAELDGTRLESADAKVVIAEDEKLPITVQGVNLGDAWGNLAVSYRSLSERRQSVEVDVNELNLILPEVAPHSVQSLEPAEHIEVGFRRPDGSFDTIPLQPVRREDEGPPTRWLIGVNLESVTIHKGAGIQIELGGALEARVGRRTRLTGRIDLSGGTLDVSGKEFVIESGSVTFNGTEPDEGIVVARARWDSPLEYSVYAEYRGTVKQGNLELFSEPPLTEDEVLSLIMFGTPEGSFGAGTGSNEAATAVGVAGGTVARGLNRALADIRHLDVSTRVDTSTGEARPELVLQLTPRVAARVTQAIGEPPPGQSPDRTFFTVDFRLFRRWSLSAQVGDEGGSTLEMIWRRRY